MTTFTSGPWATSPVDETVVVIPRRPFPQQISTLGHSEVADEEDYANARRIVSCVNALDGLPQEALDGGWTGKGISAHAKRLEEMNAVLLDALEGLYEVAAIDNDKDYAAVTNAAVVIAKARGAQ